DSRGGCAAAGLERRGRLLQPAVQQHRAVPGEGQDGEEGGCPGPLEFLYLGGLPRQSSRPPDCAGPPDTYQEQQALGGVCLSYPPLGQFLGRVYHADALDLLRRLPTESIDAVMTDPMYGSSANSKRAQYDWGKDPSGGDPEKHGAYHKPIYEE